MLTKLLHLFQQTQRDYAACGRLGNTYVVAGGFGGKIKMWSLWIVWVVNFGWKLILRFLWRCGNSQFGYTNMELWAKLTNNTGGGNCSHLQWQNDSCWWRNASWWLWFRVSFHNYFKRYSDNTLFLCFQQNIWIWRNLLDWKIWNFEHCQRGSCFNYHHSWGPWLWFISTRANNSRPYSASHR